LGVLKICKFVIRIFLIIKTLKIKFTMKKITLLSLMFAGVASFAQQVQQNTGGTQLQGGLHPINREKSTFSINATNAKAKENLQAGFHYMLDWEDAKEQYEITVNSAIATNFQWYTNAIFQDSTAKESSSTGLSNIADMRAGMVIDPKSPFYDPAQGGTPLLTASDAYTIDTVLIDAYYQRKFNINDTLTVELSWGDTSATGTVWQRVFYSTQRAWLLCPKLNSSPKHGDVSHLTAPVGNSMFIKHVLTAADTVTVGVNARIKYYIVVKIPGGAKIPANNVVAVTCYYSPGLGYTNGDIVYQYNGGAASVKNGFGVALRGQKDYNASLNGGAGNGLSYWFDGAPGNPSANPAKTKNAPMFYGSYPRYGRYTVGPPDNTWRNTSMGSGLDFCWHIVAMISNSVVGINEKQANNLSIGQNIPNPFSDVTYIKYELMEAANVTFNVFDITGKKVQSIEEGKQFAGNHAIEFNGNNLQAGVYFYTLTAGDSQVTKRMTLVK
jgi:hypothetical protein